VLLVHIFTKSKIPCELRRFVLLTNFQCTYITGP